MKILLSAILLLLFSFSLLNAQIKKLPVEINSIGTKESIVLKYSDKNQLVYFSEKALATYREYTLKYDKNTNKLIEHNLNEDRGEVVLQSKYIYETQNNIRQEIKRSGKNVRIKDSDYNNINIDSKGRLSKTVFDDDKPWELFVYDENNNVASYKRFSSSEKEEKIIAGKFNNDKSVFVDVEDLPLWFWAWNRNNMKWCSDFIGNNNPYEYTIEDFMYGSEDLEIIYEYDSDGYPVKQYYDGKLVKEFTYKNVGKY